MSQKRRKNTRPQQKPQQQSQQQVQQAQPLPRRPKKSMAMRILVLILAFAVFAGFIIMPLLSRNMF